MITFLTQKRLNILKICSIIAIIIHVFVLIRFFFDKLSINLDILAFNKQNSLIFNGWALSHLILYIFIGYYYPDEYLFVFIVSILWEFYEYSYMYINFFKNIYYKILKTEKMYILGNPYDPLINIIGYYIGSQIINK